MSTTRILRTALVDLVLNARRPLFWIWLLILALFAWGMSEGGVRIESGDADVGGLKAHITSEFAVAQLLAALVPLIYTFFIAVGAGMTILRDQELKVGAVLNATPLTASEYVYGKFLAVMVSFVVVLAAHLALMVLFYHGLTSADQQEYVGPLALVNYLRPALLMSLPTILFLAGLCFWLGERFRRPVLVFFLPVAVLLVCNFFLWNWSPSWLPESVNRLLMYIDPGGLRWLSETFLEVDLGAQHYNTQAIPYDPFFLISRGALALIGAAGVWLAARHFERSLRGRHGQLSAMDLKAAAERGEAEAPRRWERPSLKPLNMGPCRRSLSGGFFSVMAVEFRELMSSPGLYLFIPLIVLETTLGATLGTTGVFETDPLWTAGTLAQRSFPILTAYLCVLLMFYTVESLRREEATGMAPIYYATPARTTSILLGKALANSLVAVLTIGATLATSVVILAVQGQVPLDLGPFGIIWCLALLPTCLLWCTFVSLVYSIVRSRYTAYAVSLGAFIWTIYEVQTGEMTWVWNWMLWNSLLWSDMGTFEFIREELLLNRALTLATALLFTVLTVRFFPRRGMDPTLFLLRCRPRPLAVGTLKLAPFWLPVLVLGVALQWRVDDGFQGEFARKARKDYWRKNVSTWTDVRTADLVGVDVQLDLYPETRRLEARGTMTLENRTERPLHTIPITMGLGWERPESLPPVEPGEDAGPVWTLDGESFEPEDAARLMLFNLPEPLPVDAQVTVGFHHSSQFPKGATRNGGGNMEFLLPSGIVLTSFTPSFMPLVGYQPDVGVDEDNSSDAKEYSNDYYEGVTRSLFGGGFTDYHVRTKVSAPEEFTINCIGVRQSEEVQDGRRIAVWETDHPVRFFNVVCGKWDVVRGEHNTAIYHHPEHTYNVEQMLEALDGARKYYSEWFHPYPWAELKLSEFPALAGYAQGFATNITFSESIGFLTRADESDADAPFMVTAHESAHQWWGNILVPGEGPGGNLLSEGMAHFSTLLLFEQMRGLEGRIAFAKLIENQYGETRVADSERPLHKTDGSRPGDQTVTYDKAGWVFWMLLNHMGRERCLEGIRDFITHFSTRRDHPVLQDFTAHMRDYVEDTEAFDSFVGQWFYDVVVPRYKLEEVTTEAGAEGGWTVHVKVTNTGTGNMPVVVAATAGERFPEEQADDDEEPAAEEETYREVRATVSLGADESQEVQLQCAFEPELVLVDPDAKVLMLRRSYAREEL